MKKLLTFGIVFFALAISAMAQECPTGMVCLTPQQARIALENADKVVALESENKVLTQAVKDAQDNTHKMAIEFARVSGENTALKQNAVSDRAIIEILLKSAKPKRIGFINIF